MKKQFILYSTLLFTLVSCGDDFLEVTPTDRFTQESYWTSREKAEAALNATYAGLLNGNLYGGGTPVYFESITPNALNFGGTYNLIATGVHNAANTAIINSTWNAAYGGIGRANNFLANIEQVPMDETLKKRYIAEAKFLRAIFYFPLWNLYGGAPLILEETNFQEQSALPRNSAEEVLTQIIKDLDEAAADDVLPLAYTSVDKGRVTRGAVQAFKARVLLYAGRWSEAAAVAKKVIDQKNYTLFPDYRSLFYLENEGNSEVIFDVQFRYPEFAHSLDIVLDQQNGIAPLPDLVNDYYATDGKPVTTSTVYNPATPYENRDSRLQATIITEGSQYKGSKVVAGQYPRTGFGLKKYTIYKDNEKATVAPTSGQSELNYILLRYADVLLTYAEAQNEAVGPDASVYEALNLIRKRAKMPDFQPGLTKEQMREEIRHERRIELAGEGLYYFDIRRWHIADKLLNTNIFNEKGQRIDTRTFNPQRDYLWPVPSVAIQENPALAQNPGYGN